MSTETLEKLYNERILLKQLVKIDPVRYEGILNARIAEIKLIINSNYAPITDCECKFALFNPEMANEITNQGVSYLKEILNLV